ncbi:MAG TPA: hypothetical protein VHF25_02570 [Nitriliruptorales bacterium]|nr:hypothetical protein [Nitriliruptorales bacterium]
MADDLAEVPMPDRLVELLRRHRAIVAEQRLAASQWVETDALFPTRRATYSLIRNVQRRFRRLSDQLDLPDGTSPYTLRHTWASTPLTSGVPIFLVSRYARPRHDPDDRRPVRPSAPGRRRVRPAHPRDARRALPRKR